MVTHDAEWTIMAYYESFLQFTVEVYKWIEVAPKVNLVQGIKLYL